MKQSVGLARADFALSDDETFQVLCFRKLKIAAET